MKVLESIFTIIILLAAGSNVFAQNEDKAQCIDSLFMMAKKYTPVVLQKETLFSQITDNSELEKIRKLLYNSLSNSPIEYQEKLHEWTEEWKQNILDGHLPRASNRPAVRIGMLKEAVADKYGWDYVRFMETPYFMKVKILEIIPDVYVSGSREMKLYKINLKAQILDIVKSTDAYSIGDTIIVSYLPFWFRESAPPSFQKGHTYAFPMKNWGGINNVDKKNELKLNLNGLETLYEIENNIVSSPLAPEYNSSKSWESFKNEFKSKYMIDQF